MRTQVCSQSCTGFIDTSLCINPYISFHSYIDLFSFTYKPFVMHVCLSFYSYIGLLFCLRRRALVRSTLPSEGCISPFSCMYKPIFIHFIVIIYVFFFGLGRRALVRSTLPSEGCLLWCKFSQVSSTVNLRGRFCSEFTFKNF